MLFEESQISQDGLENLITTETKQGQSLQSLFFFLFGTTHSEYCAIVVCGSTAVGYLAGRCNRSRACIDEVGPGAGAGALRNAHRAR